MTSVDQKFVDYIVSKGWATLEQIDACRAELTSQIEMSGIQNQTLKGLLIHKKILSPAQVAEALAIEAKPSAASGEPSKSKPKNVYLGRWHIVEKLGSGAMGQVFKGVHEETGQVAAIKVLPKDRAESDEFRQRFMREAKAAVKLQHPHIVSGYEVDVRDGYHFYAMEYVTGGSVEDLQRSGGVVMQIPEPRALAIVRQVALGLQHAWENGVVHRDIKPANIMLCPSGDAKIADFGLAKVKETDISLTQTGTTVGTPQYLSPEQARGEEDLDVRSDMYALGITLYFMLAGDPPFKHRGLARILMAHLRDPMPDVRDEAPMVSEGAAKLIQTMCIKNRNFRYDDCRQLVEDIDRVLAGELPLGPERLRAHREKIEAGASMSTTSEQPDIVEIPDDIIRAVASEEGEEAMLAPPEVGRAAVYVLTFLLLAVIGTGIGGFWWLFNQ